MFKLKAQQISSLWKCPIFGDTQFEFSQISVDSRQIKSGDLFFALLGENFDAHQFLVQAMGDGARGLVLQVWDKKLVDIIGTTQYRKLEKAVEEQALSVFLVSDTLKALQDLAHLVRSEFEGPVLAITGSNGKTTTKEFAHTILSQEFRVHFAKGSYNNHIGLPLTLLAMPLGTELVVLEMGMNHLGEIAGLCRIAEPTHVVVTMVGSAHIENLGSQEAIAQAKEEIYQGVRGYPLDSVGDGVGNKGNKGDGAHYIFNLDNEWTLKMFRKYEDLPGKLRMWTFSSENFLPEKLSMLDRAPSPKLPKLDRAPSPKFPKLPLKSELKADVSLQMVSMDLTGMTVRGRIGEITHQVVVPVFGAQNITNLMAAAALALSVGMRPQNIWQGLEKCRTIWGRNQLLTAPTTGCRIIFDAYNSNPESMQGLLKNLNELTTPYRKYAVFAEMLELGELSASMHEQVGRWVASADFRGIYFFGPHCHDFARGAIDAGYREKLLISESYSEAMSRELIAHLDAKSLLAVKGSRGMKMERILDLLNCKPEKTT